MVRVTFIAAVKTRGSGSISLAAPAYSSFVQMCEMTLDECLFFLVATEPHSKVGIYIILIGTLYWNTFGTR